MNDIYYNLLYLIYMCMEKTHTLYVDLNSTQNLFCQKSGSVILCNHWSLAFSYCQGFLFKWKPVLQTLTNTKHIALSKPQLRKCCFFYLFRNNHHGESCPFQGLYAWITFKSLLSCLPRVMQSSARFPWQSNHKWGLWHSCSALSADTKLSK